MTKSSQIKLKTEVERELAKQPITALIGTLFGEMPSIYYLRKAQEKAIEGSEDSTMCVLGGNTYNRVAVGKLTSKVVVSKYNPQAYVYDYVVEDNIVVFQQAIYDRTGRAFVPCGGDGLPNHYLMEEEDNIRGSRIVESKLDKDKIHVAVEGIAYSSYDPKLGERLIFAETRLNSEEVRVKLRLELTGLGPRDQSEDIVHMIEMAKLLDQAKTELEEQSKVGELFSFLREIRVNAGVPLDIPKSRTWYAGGIGGPFW